MNPVPNLWPDDLLERRLSGVRPPVNLQVVLPLERLAAGLTDEVPDTCGETPLTPSSSFLDEVAQTRCWDPPEWMIMWRCRWLDR